MKLIVITQSLAGGGAEIQLLLIVRGLAARGVDCEVITLGAVAPQGRHASLTEAARRAGVQFTIPAGPVAMLRAVVRICSMMMRQRAFVWTWGYRAEILRLICLPFARGVFSIRSASESQAHRWRWVLRAGRPFTWRYVSNSHLGVGIAQRVAPGIAAKARVVSNVLEAAVLEATVKLPARLQVLEVLMLGNVRYTVKGYDLALEIARKIQAAGLPIRLRIAGAQYAGEKVLSDEISRAGIGDVVTWAGSVADPLAFLLSGHTFLLLSRYEGMPNSLFEAMAVGLPCVATAVGDLPHYAEESQGLKIVPIEDAEAAFRELCWIWNNWDEAVAMGRRAKRFCQERFLEERMIADVIEALELPPGSPEAGQTRFSNNS